MIRQLRRRHRLAWALLFPILAILLAAAFLARPEPPLMATVPAGRDGAASVLFDEQAHDRAVDFVQAALVDHRVEASGSSASGRAPRRPASVAAGQVTGPEPTEVPAGREGAVEPAATTADGMHGRANAVRLLPPAAEDDGP